MEEERRRHVRFNRKEVAIEIARPGIRGILSVCPTAECGNFSRSGLRFACEKPFDVGEKLILDLRAFNIEVHELSAVVMHTEQLEDGNWCSRVRFCFEDKRMQQPDVNHALLQIEDRLRTAEAYPYTPA